MLPALAAVLVIQIPFAGSPVLFGLAGVPVGLRAACAAVLAVAAGVRAWRRNCPFGMLDWALLAYAGAWLAAALAAPWDFPAALRTALLPAGTSLLALCLRGAGPALGSRGTRAMLAWAAVAAAILSVLAGPRTATAVSRDTLADSARLAFSQHPVFGWGPGQFRGFTPQWLPPGPGRVSADPPDLYHHTLADGGMVAASALVFLAVAAVAVLLPRLRPGPRRRSRQRDPAAVAGLAALALWLGWGLRTSLLLVPGPATALMLALSVASAADR